MDILNSLSNNKLFNHKKRNNFRKALHRKIKKIVNLKEDLHNKAIKYLTSNFGKIILPPFEIQKMCKKLQSKIARSMYNLSYFTFLTKLKNKCKEYDIDLIIRPKYYTSKTCTKCGNLHNNLKNNDIYNCIKCKLIIDRDINGARNIMLRNNYD